MSTSKKVEDLISYSMILYERKLLHATGGNTSVRDGDTVWISQTGAELGSLTEAEVVKGEWLTEAQCQDIDQALGRTWKV